MPAEESVFRMIAVGSRAEFCELLVNQLANNWLAELPLVPEVLEPEVFEVGVVAELSGFEYEGPVPLDPPW